MRKPTAERGLAWVWRTRVGDRQYRFKPCERFADDAGEKTGGRLVRLAWTHADGGQADADAVEDAAPVVVGEQQFADRLLRAVGGERREMEVVGDRGRERRAIDRDRGGEDDLRLIAGGADRFEQRAGAVEIDVVALVEIGFGLARHDAGEMEDHLRPAGDQLLRRARCGEIAGRDIDLAREARRLFRRHHVGQRQLVDRLTVELAVLDQPRGELAADHAGGAGDQNMHLTSSRYSFVGRLEAVDTAQVRK